MFDQILTLLDQGLLGLPKWQVALVVLVLVQSTIACVTVYLHRHQAHRGLDMNPVLSHICRLWLWMSTGMLTKEWVAIHRKHHAKCETKDDPHSPVIEGLNKVLWDGVGLYKAEAHKQETLDDFGHGTPDDWVENNIYTRFKQGGIWLNLALDIALFGVIGIAIWAIQMIWIPFHAAGVINGLGHFWGYRNYETQDAATNLWPVAFWIGGEELHNNHHAFPSSAKFSMKPWEFDIGWMYIKILSTFGLVKVKKVAPKPHMDASKDTIDLETIKAVFANRLHVMANYAKQVTLPVLSQQNCEDGACKKALRKARGLLVREPTQMDDVSKSELKEVLGSNQELETIYEFRMQLQEVWDRAASSHETLVQALKDWCAQAEETGIKVLQDYAKSLRNYRMVTA
ncbi:MAG: acyl-CoA desaturase [Gammaproteobacteria bacterium]|nr:acyl-CoA desaturase [Gammaproteobacteria bacterium]